MPYSPCLLSLMQSCVMKTNRKIGLSLYFTSGYVSINHTDSQGFFDFNLLIYKHLRHFTYVWLKPAHNDYLVNGCLAEDSFLFTYVTFLSHKCFHLTQSAELLERAFFS